jgi:serine/threonine protein kinase/predicted ATPase
MALLGAGGMAEVYRAKDTRLGREVAIKVVSGSLGGHDAWLERLQREAQLAAAINHPNVVSLYDVGLHDARPFFVTELLEGESIRERLLRGPVPISTALDWAGQVAQGLAAAHERGVIHRDLKPENLFLTKSGHVKLLDFGIAKLVEAVQRQTSPHALMDETLPPSVGTTGTGLVLGTPGYMSPEQVRGDPIDARTDLFSLGATIYEMLCGRRAFSASSFVESGYAILHSDPEPLPPGIPAMVSEAVDRCLEKEPGRRFHSARDLAVILESARLGKLTDVDGTLLRPSSNADAPQSFRPICFGRYRLDPEQGLMRGAQLVRVAPKSLSVLRVLAERTGQVVTKEKIVRAAWPDRVVSESALTSCIQELRHALRDDARRPRLIETVHGRGYRFLAKTTPGLRHESQLEPSIPSPRPGMPLVGREVVIEKMLSVWKVAEQGVRQLLFVTGQPGIGKTTVVEEFLRRATEGSAGTATWGQCIEHYGAGEPYQAVLEALTRLCRQPGGGGYIEALARYAPTWLVQLPALLPAARHARLRRTVAGTTRERMLRELNDALEATTTRVPLILWLEDLHWSDVSTLDWITAFAQRPERARVLLVATYRSAEVAATGHPLRALADGLRVRGCCTEIALGGLEELAVAEYIRLGFPAAPDSIDATRHLAQVIHRHTGGNPLFVVNVLGDLVARGLLFQRAGQWITRGDLSASELGISDDLRRMIERQVDRLHPAERTLLEVASVAGEVSSAATVAAGARVALEEVETTLTALARQHQFLRETAAPEWPDGTVAAGFEFLHALYRDVLYQRLPAGRRAELHRLVGAREETAYGERAPEIAAELAMHFEQGGDLQSASRYREHAANNARHRSAYKESRMHFAHALALLERQPVGPERNEREVVLRIGLGSVNVATLGWAAPEVETAYVRARALCQELGKTPSLFPALWGLWFFYWGRGPLSTAYELSENLLALARESGDDTLLLQAHHASWATAFGRGDFGAALDHASAGIKLYEIVRDPSMLEIYGSHDAALCARCFSARALALTGRTREAARVSREAIPSARELGHPLSLANAYIFAAEVDQTRRDAESTREHAAAAVALAREQGFPALLGWASVLAGWASAEQGRTEQGLAEIRLGITEMRATGMAQSLAHLFGLLAEGCLRGGQVDAGLAAIDEAFGIVHRIGERCYEAELHRLRGELLLAGGAAESEAERAFARAIAVGQSQGARLFVLRAARSVAPLWDRLGRGEEARRIIDSTSLEIDEPERERGGQP